MRRGLEWLVRQNHRVEQEEGFVPMTLEKAIDTVGEDVGTWSRILIHCTQQLRRDRFP